MNNKIKLIPKNQKGNELPEVVVTPTHMTLTTYPYGNKTNPISHSRLSADNEDNFVTFSRKMSDEGYNLLTNNCADYTLDALCYALGKDKPKTVVTTPSKVNELFKQWFPDSVETTKKNGVKSTRINIPYLVLEKLKEYKEVHPK